jgi:prepilin peptidase CpaA
MNLSQALAPENWPVFVLCVLLVVAAAIDFWKLKVPNWLTFSMILSGWAYGVIQDLTTASEQFSLTGSSFLLTGLGFLLLLPVYAVGGMGAGDVKMQMGFGAWIGAIYGLADGFWVVLYGFCLATVVGGVIALGMMFWRGDFFQNRKNVGDILRDWFTSKSVHEVAEKAAARKPRMHLLPYGVPLCIGFIGYLLLRGL